MDTTGEKQRAVRTGIMTPRVHHCRHCGVSYEVESSHDTTFKMHTISLSFGAIAYGFLFGVQTATFGLMFQTLDNVIVDLTLRYYLTPS